MINIIEAQKYCKEDISKIKNYDKAISDDTQTWDCHHMTETWWNCSKQDLIDNECYYNRKACELIFLTHADHARIHNKGELNNMYGKTHTEEARRKISAANKGRSAWNKGKTMSEEFSRKMSEVKKGQVPWNKDKTMSEEFRIKMGESCKGRIPWNKGKKSIYSEETRKKMSEAAKKRWKNKI